VVLGLPISDQHSAEALRKMVRAETRPRVGIRMLAIAALLDGLERTGAARQFGMSRNVLRIWVTRYNQGGVAGLVDRWSGGPPAKLSDAQQAQLRATVEAGAELERDGTVAFRVIDIRAVAERAFGVRYSRSGMQRLLHAIDCSWLVPRPRHPRADAAAQAAFKKGVAGDARHHRRRASRGRARRAVVSS
jgi:transposase